MESPLLPRSLSLSLSTTKPLKDLDELIPELVNSIFTILGSKNAESTYQKEENGYRVESEISINLMYKNRVIGTRRCDLIVCLGEKRLAILELKAVSSVTSKHLNQLQYYMKHFDVPLGYLINFPHEDGFPALEPTDVFRTTVLSSGSHSISDRVTRGNRESSLLEIPFVAKVTKIAETELRSADQISFSPRIPSIDFSPAPSSASSLTKSLKVLNMMDDSSSSIFSSSGILGLNGKGKSEEKKFSVLSVVSPPLLGVRRDDRKDFTYGITQKGTPCKRCESRKDFCPQHEYQRKR